LSLYCARACSCYLEVVHLELVLCEGVLLLPECGVHGGQLVLFGHELVARLLHPAHFISTLLFSVPDPDTDPDQLVFGPPGSTCFWSSRILLSSSKNSKKNLDSYCFVTYFGLFYL
jgi:hypothetical protein